MAHFVAYSTSDPAAGKLTSVGLVKTTINESATTLETEKLSGAPAQQGFYVVIDKELILVTAKNGTVWTIERKQKGTKAAEHAAKAEVLVATQMGYVPLQVEQELILGTLQTDKAEKITGSVWSEQTGTLAVQQSFDGGENWDISTSVTFSAKEGKSFEVPILAPVSQIKFVNGAAENKKLRLYARSAYQQGK